MRVLKRPQFLLDVAEELGWLNERAGPEIAEQWFGSLMKTLERLKAHPHLGRQRKDLRPKGIRSWRLEEYPRWLVFYELSEANDLVFYRVRQGNMDLKRIKMHS